MRTSTRQRGVTLRKLDLTKVSADAFATWKDQNPESNFTAMEPAHEPYAVGTAPDGQTYVVCGEGVGWEISADKPLELELFGTGQGVFGMFPSMTATLGLDEVLDLAGDEIDLADLVRTFGARLESNFAIWHQTLTGK